MVLTVGKATVKILLHEKLLSGTPVHVKALVLMQAAKE